MSYRSAFLLFLAVFVLHFSRILFFGEVIFPHDNGVETGSLEKQTGARISNRKFSDESSAFIPELTNNLRIDRKGWLETWNPHVQLGRAAYQVSGLSRAYLITNALSWFTSNPFIVYTALVLLTVGLTGSFLLLFLRSLRVHPMAAASAAIGLAFGTPISYWLTFVMFLSAICWSTCLLWLIAEFTRRPSWLLALGLAFATYSLIMTAYPQITILCTYVIGAYALVRVAQMPGDSKTKVRTTVALLGCAGAGALACLPVYLDLFLVAKNSARLNDVADSFFLEILPASRRLSELAGFVVTIFDWSWLGNAIDPKYPVVFNGLSFTPLYGSLVWLSLILKRRSSLLFWQLLLAGCFIGTICSPVYLFAVHHLGFGLSRIQLLVGGIVPGFVLGALTVDAALRGELRLTIRVAIWLLLPVILEIVVALVSWRSSIDPIAVGVTFLLIIALLAAIYYRSSLVFVAIALLSVCLYGRPLILSRPLQTIHTSSKLIDAIKTHTPDGSRFAIADGAIKFELPPNEEALLGLNSVNSYDSLSSRQYQELVSQWSVRGTRTYGRIFKFLDVTSALGDQAFPFSNVGVILSRRPLPMDGLVLIDNVAGVNLYRPTTAPINLRQTSRFRLSDSNHSVTSASSEFAELKARPVETLNDFYRIKVTPTAQETLLFLSQQYHRAWQATAHRRLLRTVSVNGFYEGIILPPFTKEVELSFRPFVLWSWLPQLLFAGAGVALLLRALVRMRREQVKKACLDVESVVNREGDQPWNYRSRG